MTFKKIRQMEKRIKPSQVPLPMHAANQLNVNDVLCVYDNVKPGDRNTTDDYSNDSVSYVKVTGINGTTVSYQNVDPEEVLFLPDTLPLKESDLSSYDATGSFTENTAELDFSAYSGDRA